MNWKSLIAALKKRGMSDENPTAETVKAFLAANPHLKFVTGDNADPVDVDVLHKAFTAKPEEVIDLEGDAQDDTIPVSRKELDGLKAQAKAGREAVRGTKQHIANLEPEGTTPQRFSIGNIDRKAYNAKAARGEANCTDADSAELCGAWTRLAFSHLHGLPNSQKSNDESICQKANVSYDFASGGYSIPEVMRAELINLRGKYSALQELGIPQTPIAPQGESVPRITGDHTVYSTSEGVALTESNASGDQVKLTPFSMDVLATVSRKLLASSAINFGDETVKNMKWSMHKKLEQIVFNGDGTSTYFNQVGIIGKLKKIITDAGGTWPTNAAYSDNHAIAAGNSWGAVTYPNLMAAFGSPAMLQNDGPVQFACSRPFFWQVVMPLMDGRGGTTREEIMNGVARPMFQGVPGVYTNALSQVSTASDIPLVVGEFNTAMKLGVVNELTEISTSTEAYWVQRKMGFLFSMYHAINVHDVGTANSTAASRVSGPLSALVIPA